MAVSNVSFDIEPAELVTLLGPSGCDRHMNRRDTTIVFEYYTIFPHLSIFENAVFGTRLKSLKTAALEKQERIWSRWRTPNRS
ncbi:hypothetical protein EOK75_08805 [Pseudorhodobacter turbinis]|uniref:Uncharacterized protein n=1 Tax=Pseudorhodobacter turbinis TaxID=2500533 RepID=A0A4P8EGI5_9RHOB|nr:hypothetical protein [Pseudorhodobacter turbinis]QCO55833.1 hypothetical protein EOK75_08805 [Pseudorhodobacter turbinis]